MVRRRAQHRVWALVAWATVALGLACVVVEWGLWGPAGALCGLAVPGFVVAWLGVGKDVRTSIRIGVAIALVSLACAGLVAVFGWSGAGLAVLVAVTTPAARILLLSSPWGSVPREEDEAEQPFDGSTRRSGSGAADASASLLAVAQMPAPDRVSTLDDDGLCQAWRRSYVRLEHSRAAGARLEVVRLRQAYLDELVRRHPVEVRHWLESGARAAGNPLPFLHRRVCREATEDSVPDGGSPEAD